jgi:quercetin dioxygenase-like cupin family protein
MKKYICIALFVMFVSQVFAQDPIETDGDKYKVIFQNERVRMLEYIDKPGDKTNLHQHPDSLVYALSPFKRKLILNGGKEVVVEKKEGEVYWVPAQQHIGENIGTTDTHVLIMELQGKPNK